MRSRFLIVSLILLTLGLAACHQKDLEPIEDNIEGTDFRFDALLTISTESDAPKASYEVEIASTAKATAQGLMHRESMAENQGMLFDPEGLSNTAFWMKNTYIPLDIIFIDTNKRISYIVENTIPFSEELIEAPDIYRYVLEINAGQTKKKELKIGDKIKWIENTSE